MLPLAFGWRLAREKKAMASPTNPIEKPGYLYINVTHDEQQNFDIYFDDLKITHIYSDIVAGSDYYPFGLAITDRQITREEYRYGYQGQFAEKDDETNWNHFELREYDPVIGRTLIPDPARQFSSSYTWVGNNPISGTDPTGGFSPIYGTDGKFLGTDNQGLQGEAIFMHESHFMQGMDHQLALEIGFTASSYFQLSADVDSWIKGMDHAATLVNRPDWDGYLTKEEADAWWKGKSGEPLFVDQSKIELPGITVASFKGTKDNSLYKNFVWGLSNTGKVYGTIKLTLINSAQGKVHIGGSKFLDEYDYRMDGRLARDFATWWGRPGAADSGKGFFIYGYGNATVPVK